MYDVESAVKGIRSMSEDGRMSLKHVLRNGLQAIVAAAETGGGDGAMREALHFADELRRLEL